MSIKVITIEEFFGAWTRLVIVAHHKLDHLGISTTTAIKQINLYLILFFFVDKES